MVASQAPALLPKDKRLLTHSPCPSAPTPHTHSQVEYINLRGTSKDNPAVCKYTGNKYYSDDWMHAH